jgi:hypothetical protein
MPIPRLPETHQRNIASNRAFQVKKKSAATAPIWNASMNDVVTQLVPADFRFRNTPVGMRILFGSVLVSMWAECLTYRGSGTLFVILV